MPGICMSICQKRNSTPPPNPLVDEQHQAEFPKIEINDINPPDGHEESKDLSRKKTLPSNVKSR